MSTNGQLVFTDVDKITFKGVGNTSNAVVDTVTGKIGVGIDSPDANLHVLGNSYVSTNLELGGTLIMGTVNVSAHHSLEAVTAEGNTTPLTVEFSNATTGIVTTGNVEVGKELTVSGNVEVGTANLFVDTANSRVGIGEDSPDATLHVAGNAYVSSNLTVSGDATGATTFGPVAGMGFVDSGVSFCGIKVGVKGTSPYSRTALSVEDNGNTILHVDGNNQRVGIGATSTETTLHITNETATTGTGDAFISNLTGNTNNRKPTECLRLQGPGPSSSGAAGNGALLRFTNKHNSGTNPNTGEYNLAGIAGYDHDNAWGGGLAFYTSPGTGSGGDDLTLRMSLDSSGGVNIPGPTTGAAHGSASMLYLLNTCFYKEWSYTNYVAPVAVVTFSTSTEIPAGAKSILAEVYLSRDNMTGGDHQVHVIGKNHTALQQNWLGGPGQPSLTFGSGVDTRQTVEILMPGESDQHTHYFGNWHSSVIIPLEDNKIYYSNHGNSSSTGWIYIRVRGYYI